MIYPAGLYLDEESGMFVVLHDEECGEVDGLRVYGTLVHGNDHELFTSRELVEEETIIRTTIFGLIYLAY